MLFLAVLALVLWGSLTPRPPELSGRISDKLQHMGAYFALAGLAGLAFPRRLLPIAAALVGFGVLVEIGQAIMPYGRHGTVFDGLANTLGVALATGLHLWGLSPERRSRSPFRRERARKP
jgi:VanZ family protein